MKLPSLVLLCAVSVAGMAQPVDSLDLKSKLHFHAESVVSPWSVAGSAAYAGILQGIGTPEEWGQDAGAYGKRFASTVGCSGIHAVLAFGLDSTLHQDPRYYRSGSTGIWPRTRHALRGTILTRTDNGGETLSTWRLGSAYGAAFISNQWYPDRYHTVSHGFVGGSYRIGFDLAKNVIAEFWPDIKKKISRRKP
jgi:hypothetical protein